MLSVAIAAEKAVGDLRGGSEKERASEGQIARLGRRADDTCARRGASCQTAGLAVSFLVPPKIVDAGFPKRRTSSRGGRNFRACTLNCHTLSEARGLRESILTPAYSRDTTHAPCALVDFNEIASPTKAPVACTRLDSIDSSRTSGNRSATEKERESEREMELAG